MEKCCECDKAFSTLYNLRKHAKKFHPDNINLIAPKKKFTYRCEPCKRNFNLLRDFNCHKKRHSLNTALTKLPSKKKCALCQFKAPKAELLIHFETEHDIQIKTDTFQFNSFEEFLDWKTKLENSTQAQFVKERGNFYSNNNKIINKYVCHRSGHYVSKGKGLRRLKKQGSNKIDGFCPASIKVEKENDKYKAGLISQHVGHQNELEHLSLTLEEREKLTNLLALKVPFTEILDQVRDSLQGSRLERIHLLTRRDLYNIVKSFNLESTVTDPFSQAFVDVDSSTSIHINAVCDDKGDVLSVLDGCNSSMSENELEEESKLAQEKEKIITDLIPDLIKVVENISCMEQVDTFKKLYAAIAPTLSAIARRQEGDMLYTDKLEVLFSNSSLNSVEITGIFLK